MTNGEKYKTAQERAEVFEKFCIPRKVCDGCELDCDKAQKPSYCKFAWLDLEAEEKKPLPCPFCGCETIMRTNWNSTHQVVCNSNGCWYCSKCETTSAEAISAHNRVAKKCVKGRE